MEVIRWNTYRDVFQRGQWFHGRIYQRRSDLSPDGEHLLYFVSKFSGCNIADGYTYAWTAVSRPPWLTALALWPKGNCWWGGGLFLSNRRVLLNHRPREASFHPNHKPPATLRVDPNPDASGEDDPLYSTRLTRDGWVVTQEWERQRPTSWKEGFRTITPERRERVHPSGHITLRMERSFSGYRYRERFEILSARGAPDLTGVDWADWDRGGRLVFLRHSAVWVARVNGDSIEPPTQLIDLTDDKPTTREAPPSAHKW
ncbi:MAG TPA: hypothetical protein VFK13_08605 [Gemmatimonadaceae bacterium]|nr:hypothetical protein [Gemmatimonadaceae bacterium]